MKILIATDGSDYSTAAVEESCRMIIRPESADVLIVSAYENAYPLSAEPFALSAEYYQQLENAVKEQTVGFVEAAKTKIREAFPSKTFPVTTEILRGSPAQLIVERAVEWGGRPDRRRLARPRVLGPSARLGFERCRASCTMFSVGCSKSGLITNCVTSVLSRSWRRLGSLLIWKSIRNDFGSREDTIKGSEAYFAFFPITEI